MAFQWFQRAAFVGGGASGASAASADLRGLGTLRGARFSAPIATAANLQGVLDAQDIYSYLGATLPSDGAEVGTLLARRDLLTSAIEISGTNRPTFGLDAGGTHRHGLRFTSADSEALSWPGVVNQNGTLPFNSSDQAFTFAVVFRPAATPSGTQAVLSISRSGAFNNFRERVSLDLTATQFVVHSGTNGSATDYTNAAIVAEVPVAGETYVAIGRHGTAGAGDNQNKIDLRRAGATTTVTSANSLTLNYASTAALDSGTIGAHRRGSLTQHFNGWLFDVWLWNRRLTDTEAGDMLTALRLKWGVS